MISNTTVYFSYRDSRGQSLGTDATNSTIEMTFFYKFTPLFFANITTCAHINIGDDKWSNETCTTAWDKRFDLFTCFCKHSSFFSVIEDYFERPLPEPPVYLTFRDWFSFVAFVWTIFFGVMGVMTTYAIDLVDFKKLRDIEFKKDDDISRDEPLSLVSLAQKRQVSMVAYSDAYAFSRYYSLLLLHIHPLLQLRYKLDPQVSKLSKFLLIYTRMVISMCISFLCLFMYTDIKETDMTLQFYIQLGAVVFVTPFLYLPLPSWFYNKLRHSY